MGLLPSFLQRKAKRPQGVEDDDDIEKTIFRNLWKQQRLLPPRSKNRAMWDAVRQSCCCPFLHSNWALLV
jgi:hypothetical protein